MSEDTEATPNKRILNSLKDTVAVLGGLVGFSVAVLWITGRAFAAGYFEAMNIPSYHVSFSVWEYSEKAWLVLVGMCVLILVSVTIFDFVFLIFGALFAKIGSALKAIYDKTPLSKIQIPLRDKINKKMIFGLKMSILALYLLFAIDVYLRIANQTGYSQGNSAVFNRSMQVELVSETPLNLGSPQLISSQGQPTAFVYEDFRLLTHNNGKYYLFKEIDPATCKPAEVFIVDDSRLIQTNLKSTLPITTTCVP